MLKTVQNQTSPTPPLAAPHSRATTPLSSRSGYLAEAPGLEPLAVSHIPSRGTASKSTLLSRGRSCRCPSLPSNTQALPTSAPAALAAGNFTPTPSKPSRPAEPVRPGRDAAWPARSPTATPHSPAGASLAAKPEHVSQPDPVQPPPAAPIRPTTLLGRAVRAIPGYHSTPEVRLPQVRGWPALSLLLARRPASCQLNPRNYLETTPPLPRHRECPVPGYEDRH